MKFIDQTLLVLNNFKSINPTIKFQEGNVIKTRDPGKKIMASYKLNVGAALADDGSELEGTIPQNFAIYDLHRLLAISKLLGNPKLSFDQGKEFVTLSGENNSVRYGFSDPSLIEGADYDKEYAIAAPVATVEISKLKLAKVIDAAGILNAPNISVESKGGVTTLIAHNVKQPSSDKYNVLLDPCDTDFVVNFSVENFKFISDDYDLTISKKILTKFTGNLVEYAVAAEIIL